MEGELENIELAKETVDKLKPYHDETLDTLNDMLMSVVHDWSVTKDNFNEKDKHHELEIQTLRQ